MLKSDEKIISEPITIANKFNDYFSSIASIIQGNIPNFGNFEHYIKRATSTNSFFFKPVSENEMLEIFKQIDSSLKSNGDYSIPKQLFQYIPKTLAKILTIIVNLTFETCIFPTELKTAKVIPIYI